MISRRGSGWSEETHPADVQRRLFNTVFAFSLRTSTTRSVAQCSLPAGLYVAPSLLRWNRMLHRRFENMFRIAHRVCLAAIFRKTIHSRSLFFFFFCFFYVIFWPNENDFSFQKGEIFGDWYRDSLFFFFFCSLLCLWYHSHECLPVSIFISVVVVVVFYFKRKSSKKKCFQYFF